MKIFHSHIKNVYIPYAIFLKDRIQQLTETYHFRFMEIKIIFHKKLQLHDPRTIVDLKFQINFLRSNMTIKASGVNFKLDL